MRALQRGADSANLVQQRQSEERAEFAREIYPLRVQTAETAQAAQVAKAERATDKDKDRELQGVEQARTAAQIAEARTTQAAQVAQTVQTVQILQISDAGRARDARLDAQLGAQWDQVGTQVQATLDTRTAALEVQTEDADAALKREVAVAMRDCVSGALKWIKS